ncbi:hypothetical protein [Chitinophaga sp.]|uniref:hypothetical protein n=1 Tax=Chitinophaga sp. TaxID=1869181 RepID=UPI0031CFB750
MKINHPTALINFLPDDSTVELNDPIHVKYRACTKLDKADQEQLVLIGEIDIEDGTDVYEVYKDQYWQPDAPIALQYYPFNGCSIYRYQQNGGLYFVYTELGGHAPEIRCRWIQRHLIVNL